MKYTLLFILNWLIFYLLYLVEFTEIIGIKIIHGWVQFSIITAFLLLATSLVSYLLSLILKIKLRAFLKIQITFITLFTLFLYYIITNLKFF